MYFKIIFAGRPDQFRKKPASVGIAAPVSSAIIGPESAVRILCPKREDKQMLKQAKAIMPGFLCVMTLLFRRSSYALALLFFLGFSGFVVAGDCEMDETDQAMLNRVNEARSQPRQCGDEDFDAAETLSWNCKLEDAARAHSRDMAELEFFSHTGPEGVQVGERVNDRGYRWSAVGENIAAGQKSVDQVVDGWLSSPGHCANIMSAEFTAMGATRIEAPGSQYSPFWTQVFARPR